MNWFGFRNRERPFPELLAAYADGELDAAGRARVEAWLAQHPDAAVALEVQRKLSRRNRRFWQVSAGPAPSDASWSRLVNRVHKALAAPSRPTPAPRSRHWPFWAVTSTAAAALLAVTLLRPVAPVAPPPGQPDDAWAVATDADVEIVGILDGDADRLLVGRPPLAEPIVLASNTDVTVEQAVRDTDGMMPLMPPPGAGVPMIVAPLAGQ